jgi:hypothetical protein
MAAALLTIVKLSLRARAFAVRDDEVGIHGGNHVSFSARRRIERAPRVTPVLRRTQSSGRERASAVQTCACCAKEVSRSSRFFLKVMPDLHRVRKSYTHPARRLASPACSLPLAPLIAPPGRLSSFESDADAGYRRAPPGVSSRCTMVHGPCDVVSPLFWQL